MRPASTRFAPDPGGPGRESAAGPEHPPLQAMADFLRECGRRDSQHGAAGVGQAVEAYPAVDDMGQRAAVARPGG